jgi:uncharacterized protein (TIGR00297 family)
VPVDGFAPLLCVPLIAGGALLAGAVTRGGALGGLVVGSAIAAGGGWAGFWMLATLLVVGTAVSRRGGRRRDAVQVYCNGGVAAGAALAAGFGVTGASVALAAALATALSDTLSSELGRRYGGRPRMLLLGPPAEPGADGAMSGLGTVAGIVGAALVAGVGALLGHPGFLVVAVAGLLGNLADSVVGWAIQPGLGPRGNDLTNLIATAAGACAAYAL